MFSHGDAEEAVHAGHGDSVMGDGDEFCFGLFNHFIEQVAVTRDIGVIERGVDFVEHANRSGV